VPGQRPREPAVLRADLLDQLQTEDYVTIARAKGASPWRVLLRHALRNSLFGLLTVAGLQIGVLLGTTVVEQIFSVPGVGQQLLSAIQNQDVPVVEGIVTVIATITVLANLTAVVLYAVLDPRIRK
jgi:peptide/nickel transport system permease protein